MFKMKHPNKRGKSAKSKRSSGKRLKRQRSERVCSKRTAPKKNESKLLLEDEGEGEKVDETFLQFAGVSSGEVKRASKTGKGAKRVSMYNYKPVSFLVNGATVECLVQTIPEGAIHSFPSYPATLVVYIVLGLDLTSIYSFSYHFIAFGMEFYLALFVNLLFMAFPSLFLEIYIGSRFKSHVDKIYLGFIGLVIFKYLQFVFSFLESLKLSSNALYSTLCNLFLYFPIWTRCLPPEDVATNFAYFMGKYVCRITLHIGYFGSDG